MPKLTLLVLSAAMALATALSLVEPRRRVRRVAALCAMVTVAVAALFMILGAAGGGPQEIRLQGVPPERLKQGDISLEEPDTRGLAIVSAESARPAAGWPDAAVKEVVLVRVRDTGYQPPLDRIAWAFNFEPASVAVPGGPPPEGPEVLPKDVLPKTLYFVAFVDAQSGAFLFADSASTFYPLPDTGNAIFQRDVLIPDEPLSSAALATCSEAASRDRTNIQSVFRAYESTAGLVADWRNEPRDATADASQLRSLPAHTPVVVCIFDGEFPKSPPSSGSGTPWPNFNRELAVIAEGNWIPLVLGYQSNLPADYGPEAVP